MLTVRGLFITTQTHKELEIRFERVDFGNGRIKFLINLSRYTILGASEIRNETNKYVTRRQNGHRTKAYVETCVREQDGQHAVLLNPKKFDTNEF